MIDVSFRVVFNLALLGVLPEHAHKGRQDGFVANSHQVAEVLPEVDRGLLQMVVGDLSEHMMHLLSWKNINIDQFMDL